MINEKILNYRIIRLIGEGGMASVYEAVHEKFANKRVAIKILNPNLTANKNIRYRFLNEAKIMAELEHPNIVTVHDYDEQTKYLAIIMEMLKGQTLSEHITQSGAFIPDYAIALFYPILDAFEFAHKNGVVHRDVKPTNIFITDKGIIKILDFGIAKLFDNQFEMTITGMQMGTLTYMSPEQIVDSKRIDLRSDIYSLGVTLYFMLAGKPAYNITTSSDYHIRKAIVEEPFPRLPKHTEFQLIIDKATAKKPEDRFQTCGEFRAALQNPLTFNKQNDKTLIDINLSPYVKPNFVVNYGDKTLIDPYGNEDETLVDAPTIVTKRATTQTITKPAKTLVNDDFDQNTKKSKKRNRFIFIGIASISSIILLILIALLWPSITYIFTINISQNEAIKQIEESMVSIAGGTFEMGSNESENTKPIHSVTVSSFNIGKYEVTQAQWKAIMEENPSYFRCADCPVEQVSWDDVQSFILKLNQLTGKNYRLPTEAEWEYAARCGNKCRGYNYSGSDNIDDVAWVSTNSSSKTQTVGQKQANELGIYDMSGNVWEWCSDWYDANYYANSSSSNPQGASSGSYRVLRGGSWSLDAAYCRVAYRDSDAPDYRGNRSGFRLVLVF